MPQSARNDKVQSLAARAVELGAAAARFVAPSSVVTAEWVRLKCQFGCDEYGQHLTCPPHSPTPSTTRKVLDEYTTLLLVHLPGDSTRLRALMAELERETFLMGFHKAWAMPVGPCRLCKSCPMKVPCANPFKSRPPMEACGIDVYQTARNNGFQIEVITSHDQTPDYFALLLVE